VVVVSAVENQKGTGDRGQEQQPIFSEHVIVEHASTFFPSNTILSGLVIAVQGGQVDVRTCVVLQPVLMVRSEACMDDESGEAV
jgi:hypothetical protein